jgi:hypothetical protein
VLDRRVTPAVAGAVRAAGEISGPNYEPIAPQAPAGNGRDPRPHALNA